MMADYLKRPHDLICKSVMHGKHFGVITGVNSNSIAIKYTSKTGCGKVTIKQAIQGVLAMQQSLIQMAFVKQRVIIPFLVNTNTRATMFEGMSVRSMSLAHPLPRLWHTS